MTRPYEVIDADGHVLEPANMWLDYMEPRFRDRAPCIIPNEEGVEILALGGQEITDLCRAWGRWFLVQAITNRAAATNLSQIPSLVVEMREGGKAAAAPPCSNVSQLPAAWVISRQHDSVLELTKCARRRTCC
jgi:hypothetical protein